LVGTQHVDGLTAIAARIDEVTAWAPAGQNYVTSGVLLLTFSTSGTPTAAVSVSGTGTALYFSDADAQRYFTDPSATATGANGSALFVGSATSASGGESDGCTWPAFPVNWSSVSGVVTYGEFMCQ
jgi:nucleoid-associated protein YgaU